MSAVTDTALPAEPSPAPTAAATIVARRSGHFLITKVLLIPLGCVGMGLWFGYDGFYKYPAMNREAAEKHRDILPHGGWDVPSNQLLFYVLIPLGLALLAYFLYRSRGAYEYDGQTLRVPGHPPVPNGAIQTLDRAKWDRKGIAHLTYQLASEPPRRLTIDGYIYEQRPTDQIFARIEALFTPPAVAEVADPAADGGTSSIADV